MGRTGCARHNTILGGCWVPPRWSKSAKLNILGAWLNSVVVLLLFIWVDAKGKKQEYILRSKGFLVWNSNSLVSWRMKVRNNSVSRFLEIKIPIICCSVVGYFYHGPDISWAMGQTFYDLPTRLHLFYCIFHAIRINKCNFFLVYSVSLGIF